MFIYANFSSLLILFWDVIVLLSFDGFFKKEFFKLTFIAVKDVYVDIAPNAFYTTVRAELPVGKLDVGLVFAIAGYPYPVVALQVGLLGEVFVDEPLVDIEDRLYACPRFYDLQPFADMPEHGIGSSHLTDLCIGGLYVQYGWEVALAEEGVLDEIAGLDSAGSTDGEEVIGPGYEAVFSRLFIVVQVESVSDGDALGRFDVNEGYWIVDDTRYIAASFLPDVSDAEFLP